MGTGVLSREYCRGVILNIHLHLVPNEWNYTTMHYIRHYGVGRDKIYNYGITE